MALPVKDDDRRLVNVGLTADASLLDSTNPSKRRCTQFMIPAQTEPVQDDKRRCTSLMLSAPSKLLLTADEDEEMGRYIFGSTDLPRDARRSAADVEHAGTPGPDTPGDRPSVNAINTESLPKNDLEQTSVQAGATPKAGQRGQKSRGPKPKKKLHDRKTGHQRDASENIQGRTRTDSSRHRMNPADEPGS